jgi:hypothetical protein
MKYLTTTATAAAILLVPLLAFAGNKDAFRFEAQQQHDARKADLKEIQERQERTEELQKQHEADHPEVRTDEVEDDVDE